MSIWDWLHGRKPAAAEAGETATVRRIVSELERLAPERARYLAAFAYVLSRVANADLELRPEERQRMEEIAQRVGGLSPEQAVLVVEIARSQERLFGGTESYLVTREFKRSSSQQERRQLLGCLFAVAAADRAVSTVEEEAIRQIARELDLGHEDFVSSRSAFAEFRTVLQPFRPPAGEPSAGEPR